MFRGSTPLHTFTVDRDLREAVIYVTYQQNGVTVMERTNDSLSVTETSVALRLTQEETLEFQSGVIHIQIRYVLPDGTADASTIMQVPVQEILKDGVIG